jgi:thiamine biosynthesis lipoprotein
MGTVLALRVEAPSRDRALAASERVVAAIVETENRLSTWNASSELSRFNDSPSGVPVPVSAALFEELSAARHWSVETSGAFSLGVGTLVRIWGLREGGRQPTDAEIDSARTTADPGSLELADGHATRLHERLVVEEGAFGKGAGLDRAVERLVRTDATGAVLDFGGQVTVWGDATAVVAVADPRNRGRAILELNVSSGSVASSGNSEHGILVGGQRMGHILDPRTGRPTPNFGSVTVWADRGLAADCLSTALYVLGPERALEWAARHDDVAVVVVEIVEEKLRVRVSESLRERVRALTDDVVLGDG